MAAAMAIPAAMAAGEVLSSGISSAFNVKLARENRRWQEKMSSTAHQREVEDLKKAGLNPILTVPGAGASTPPGNVAQIENPAKGLSRAVLEGRLMMAQEQSNSANAAKALADKNVSEKQLQVQDAQILKEKSQANLNSANAAKAAAQVPKEKVKGNLFQSIDKVISPKIDNSGNFLDKAIKRAGESIKAKRESKSFKRRQKLRQKKADLRLKKAKQKKFIKSFKGGNTGWQR